MTRFEPSQIDDSPWLYASRIRETSPYPAHTRHGGKWLIFLPREEIDEAWSRIRRALLDGKLGNTAKVSTAQPSPHVQDPNQHVICVYTYDHRDIQDKEAIRDTLHEMGFTQTLPYKTDEATRQQTRKDLWRIECKSSPKT